MSYVAETRILDTEAKLNREETSSNSRKPINKGLLNFIVSSATIKSDFVQRGRIHGS